MLVLFVTTQMPSWDIPALQKVGGLTATTKAPITAYATDGPVTERLDRFVRCQNNRMARTASSCNVIPTE